MLKTFVNSDGSLTSVGYGIFIAMAVIAVILVIYLLKKDNSKKAVSTKQLTICSMCLALAFATSYIKLFSLPFGGSVTLFSMLFIALVGYFYGPKVGILIGFVYGIMQFLQEPYFLTPMQVCFDYIFAYSALGFSGFFRNKKHGLLIGYIFAIFSRGIFNSIGGYLFWMAYMPKSFPKALASVYPLIYNYSFIGAEGVITVIIISIPAVKKAIEYVKRQSAI